MALDCEAISARMHLSRLQRMRLSELAERYPTETAAMLVDGTLAEHLESWERSAEAYRRSLMDPSAPGSAGQRLAGGRGDAGAEARGLPGVAEAVAVGPGAGSGDDGQGDGAGPAAVIAPPSAEAEAALARTIDSILGGPGPHDGWPPSQAALDPRTAVGRANRSMVASAAGERALVEAEDLAATTVTLPDALAGAIEDALPALGLVGSEHILLDNCGRRLADAVSRRSRNAVVLERDWRLLEGRQATCRVGSGTSSTFPADAFQLAIAVADPTDPHACVASDLAGLAEGGVLVAVCPSTLLDGDRGRLGEALDQTAAVGATRVSIPGASRAPATDVLVLRKVGGGNWVRELGRGGSPSATLIGAEGGLEGVRSQEEAAARVAERLSDQLVRAVGGRRLSSASHADGPAVALGRIGPQDMIDYEVDADGGAWIVSQEGVADLVAAAGTARAARIADSLSLANATSALLELEGGEGGSEGRIAEAIASLASRHAEFVRRHGAICEGVLGRDVSPVTKTGFMLAHLEVTDSRGRFERVAPILRERVAWPEARPPERADDPDTAISMSLERTGGVSLPLVASLLGTDEAGAMERLGERVIADPDTGALVTAEDYLSGDLGGKLDHVRGLISEVTEAPARRRRDEWLREAGVEALVGRSLANGSEASEIRATDQWSFLTGRDEGVATPLEGWSRSVVLRCARRSRRELVQACILMARDAAPGVWDGRVNHERAEAAKALLSGMATLRPYVGSTEDRCAVLCSLLSAPALTEDVLAAFIRGLEATRDGREIVRAVGTLLGDVAGPAAQAARSLIERPEAAEWLATSAVRARTPRAGGGPGPSEPPALLPEIERAAIDRDGYADFCARRRTALDVDVDEARLGALREVESRLESALPQPVDRRDISARLGSPWIPAGVYLDFVLERITHPHATAAQLAHLVITRDAELATWDVKYADQLTSEGATARYAIESRDANDASAFRILANAMRGAPTIITRTVGSGDGARHVVDEELTLLAADKRAALEGDFAEWLWSDDDRAASMAERYNEVMNRHAARTYDGSYLTFPGASPGFEFRSHQRDAIARTLRSEEGTLLAHAVGAGKTFEGIGAAHESKRLGKCAKPLVAVPPSVIAQWAGEWGRVYPQDRLLVMDAAASRNPETRRRFWEAASMEGWDAVIVPHSQLDALSISPARRAAEAQARIAELRTRLDGRRGPRSTLRRRQASIRQAIRDLERELLAPGSGGGPYLDQVGCDMLIVDEAHRYKHLGVRTSMSVAGIDQKGNKMSANLMALCDHLRSVGKGSNIVFLTGTPLTNSVCELYTMQSYLAPKSLAALGIDGFDAWAATFGEVTREVEVRPEGGLQVKDRFSRFTNLPELMSSVHGWCDLVTNDDLPLELPDVRVVNVDVPPTAAQRLCMRWLEGRGEAVRRGLVPQTVDNMLAITTDGKKVALDPMLLFPDDPEVPPLEGGKVDKCVENVLDVWRRTTTSPGGERVDGVQLVFCDTSTDSGPARNVQADLARRLVEAGIPADQVRTVGGSLSAARRERLFALARSGDVRVLVGSTQTLGTGVSVQDRLAAIHDLDCPWRASDLEQRMGRIKRQGNMFAGCDWFQPRAYRYATVGTFDSFLYQTTSRKGSFVAQVMTNASPLREASELSDVVLTLSEMKALSSGDPTVRRRLELDNEVKSLQHRRSAWSREMESARARLEEQVVPTVGRLELECAGSDRLRQALAAVAGLRGQGDGEVGGVWAPITVSGETYGTDKDSLGRANLALEAAVALVRPCDSDVPVARIGDVSVAVSWQAGERGTLPLKHLAITCADGATVTSGSPARRASRALPHLEGPVNQAFRLVADAPNALRRRERALARARGEEADLRRRLEEAWPLEAELARKRAELAALPSVGIGGAGRGERYPHVSDVRQMLAGGQVLDVGQGSGGTPALPGRQDGHHVAARER